MKPNTPNFIAERLVEARKAMGLTGAGLAKALDVSRQQVSNYEKGKQSPSPEVMQKITETLGIPLTFFTFNHRHESLDTKLPVFFRASTTSKSDREQAQIRYQWLLDIYSFLESFIDFPVIEIPDFNLPSDPKMISDELIEELTQETRKFWGLGLGPISNLIWLLENKGVIAGCCHFGANIDGLSNFYGQRPYVILGIDKKSAVRSRFSAAHELGHLILHRNIPSYLLEDEEYFKLIENQANRFAGAFIFPEPSFFKEVTKIDLDYFRILKSRWKVSIGMMVFRAKDLGLIDQDFSSRLWRNIARRGWRKIEPLDDIIPIEEPHLLSNAFKLLIEQSICTRHEILCRIPYPQEYIESICGLEKNYLNENVIDLRHYLKPKEQNKKKQQQVEYRSTEQVIIPFFDKQE